MSPTPPHTPLPLQQSIKNNDKQVTSFDFIARTDSLISIATAIGTPLLKSSRSSRRMSKETNSLSLILNNPVEKEENTADGCYIHVHYNIKVKQKLYTQFFN